MLTSYQCMLTWLCPPVLHLQLAGGYTQADSEADYDDASGSAAQADGEAIYDDASGAAADNSTATYDDASGTTGDDGENPLYDIVSS